jgi:hypothetical protein
MGYTEGVVHCAFYFNLVLNLISEANPAPGLFPLPDFRDHIKADALKKNMHARTTF